MTIRRPSSFLNFENELPDSCMGDPTLESQSIEVANNFKRKELADLALMEINYCSFLKQEGLLLCSLCWVKEDWGHLPCYHSKKGFPYIEGFGQVLLPRASISCSQNISYFLRNVCSCSNQSCFNVTQRCFFRWHCYHPNIYCRPVALEPGSPRVSKSIDHMRDRSLHRHLRHLPRRSSSGNAFKGAATATISCC
jgi:hypothetical protein